MIIDSDPWPLVGNKLKIGKYKRRYVTPERYDKPPNPLESLVAPVGMTSFFGTKVCNIFIVAIPYGWQDSTTEKWPPDGYEEAKQRHIQTYKKFTKYETHVYMDMNIVKKIMAADADSNFETMMNKTKIYMQGMCTDLAAYGFKYENDITSDVTDDYFYEVLDAFYKV